MTAAVSIEGNDRADPQATAVLRTLVVCDLVESTALVERLGDQRAAELFRRHDRLARALVHEHGGREIDKTDGFLLMFERPIQAVGFALAYLRDIAAFNVAGQEPLAVRFGIHVGEVMVWDNHAHDVQKGAKPTEVEGLVKPVAARLMQLALPNQILLSGVAYDIAHRAQGELGAQLARVRWRTHGRYRFKGVPDPVPVFEVGEEGFAPLKPPPWSGKAHREVPFWQRPASMAIEGLVVLTVVVAGAWYLIKPAPAIAFANRDWVVVGSVKNLTSQKVFDDSLQTAFRVGLEQSRYVNVIPELQVRSALKRMERDPIATVLDRGTGSELALRENARALILPTIAEVGDRVRLTAEVVDPNTQTSVYSDSIDGRGEDSVLPSLDELLKRMRGRLGESLAAIDTTSAPLAQITTGNLEALRALGKAEVAQGKGDVNGALALLQEALRLDPKFALAWSRLSTIQSAYLNDPKAANSSLASAQANRQRLSAREQLFLDGTAAQYEDANRWVERWTAAVELYPDAIAAQQNLGLGYYWYLHRLDDAIPHFTAIAQSRHPLRGLSWGALAVIETERGNDRAAMEYVAKSRELTSVLPHFEDVAPDLAARRYTAVLARLQATPASMPDTIQAEKQLKLAAVALDQGNDDEAGRALAAAAAASAKTPSQAQRARVQLAQAAFDLATHAAAADATLAGLVDNETKRLADAGPSVDGSASIHLALAAMLAIRSGNAPLAHRALEAARHAALDHGFYDRGALWRTADCEASSPTDAAARVDCLSKLVDGREYVQTHIALKRAYEALGDKDTSAQQSTWLQQHRGQAVAELENEAALIPNLIAMREPESKKAPTPP